MKAQFLFTRQADARANDLGRMTLRELIPAYFTYPAVIAYLALAAIGLGGAVYLGALAQPVRTALAFGSAILMYPIVWYVLHRFVLHSRFLYRFSSTARLWKRIHFDHHQDPNKLDVLFGSLTNTIPTLLIATLPVGWLIGGWSAALTASNSHPKRTACSRADCSNASSAICKPRDRAGTRGRSWARALSRSSAPSSTSSAIR